MIQLYPHQEEALKKTEGQNKVAYYLDMGLGKTFVGSEKMKNLGNRVNLIVCQKSKVNDWIEHFKTHYEYDFDVWDLTKKSEFECFFNTVNTMKWISTIGVINYDLIFRRPDLLNLENFTLMLDESSLIQNEGTARAKFILKMQPSNVILLSGTPTSGKYENLWSQLHLLGWNISQSIYNKQYVNWKKIEIGGFPQFIVDKDEPYKNVDRLKMKMREHGAVFMKTEEAFELPEQTFIPVTVPISKEYKKFKRDSLVTVDGYELIGDTTLTKMMYQRQLCGQFSKDKMQRFKELVESTNDRLIVFYNFNQELWELKKIAADLNRPVSEVNGHEKNLDAYENEDNSITLIQYQSGAMGLNLQKANKIIYYTLPLLSELFEQSKKRIHRIGQEQPCFYYLMICKGSVEEQIYQTLEMRKDYTDELFRESDNLW